MSLIEIIRTTFYYALYAGITLPLLALLLSIILQGLRSLSPWAQGEEGGVSPDAEK